MSCGLNSRPELIVRPHEKVICRQTAMSNLPSDFDYSATNNGAMDGALCRRGEG
jgi:hypothetical protein